MANSVNRNSSARRVKDLKLNALLEITKAINNNFSTSQLLEIFQDVLQNQLKIGKLALFSNSDKDWKCILKYGVGDEYNSIDVERDLVPHKDIGTISFSEKNLSKSFEILVPVYHKSQPLAYVLIGDLEDKVEVSPAIKHLNFVQILTNIIVVAIENKKLAKESLQQAATKKELELASEMQSMLFPQELPHDSKLDTAAFYLPHQEVGGDYYDFIWLNENEFVFCVADVSGKGVAAALLMSNFQANMRVLLKHTTTLTELIHELNSKVLASAKGEKFITLFIAKYNLNTHLLTYVNAAHNPPVIATKSSLSDLRIGCTGLGMFDEIPNIKEGVVEISEETVIVCYTDGLVELENNRGEDFGTNGLKQLVKENFALDMTSLNNTIIEGATTYKEARPYIDDIALFSLKIY